MFMRFFSILSLFAATSAVAETSFELMLPGCPFAIQGTLSNFWDTAENSPSILRELEENTARKATYVQAWIKPERADETSALLAGTLGSLEPHQGRLTQDNFEDIAAAFNKSTKAPSKALSDLVRGRVNELSHGSSQSLSIQSFDMTDSFRDSTSVTVLGATFGKSAGQAYNLMSIQKHIFLDGCIATLQVSFPLGRYSYDEMLSAVDGVSLIR